LTIKYLRRESFSFYPTLLSKIAITADQKAPRNSSQGFGDRKVPDLLGRRAVSSALPAPDSSIPVVHWWS